MKVLIIEDHEDIAEYLTTVTRDTLGLDTEAVMDGQRALDLIESGQQWDLILLDLHMPNVSGWELFDVLRAKLPGSKIAVVTADKKATEQFKEKADAVFFKPPRLHEFIVKLNSLLSQIQEREKESS